MKITVYSKPGCAPCHGLKQFLIKKNLPFINRDVEDPEVAAEAFAYSGLTTVPITVVNKNGVQSVISGYNLPKLMDVLA